MFNDNIYGEALKHNFEGRFPIGTFSFEPRFGNRTVGQDEQIENYLKKEPQKTNPTPVSCMSAFQ
ncbi:hypothetical protein SAMN05216436_1162 [bacterium A37T11]|nr:hypothetical protein SAMN05216436_1162 [bacterium A37T11]